MALWQGCGVRLAFTLGSTSRALERALGPLRAGREGAEGAQGQGASLCQAGRTSSISGWPPGPAPPGIPLPHGASVPGTQAPAASSQALSTH